MSSFFAQTKDNMKYLHADTKRLSPKKRRKKRKAIATVCGLFMVLLQAIIMLLFLVQIFKLDMLPLKYLIMMNVILILLLIYIFFSQFTNANIFGKILSVFLSVVMIFGFLFASKVNTTLGKLNNKNIEGQVAASNKKINEEPFIIYLSGMDDEGKVTLYGHSDVNIYAVCNPKTRQMLLLSTPRDSMVKQTGFPDDANTPVTGLDKLTHASNSGIQYSIDALTNLYGIGPDYYVRLNFTGCVGIVDALGGITVNSDVDFTNGEDAWYYQYHFTVGENHLNGDQTIAFVRERQAFDDGDFQRGRDQQAAVAGIINKATSPSILTTYGAVLDSVSEMFLTNMPASAISTLVKDQISDTTSWNIQSFETEGEPTQGVTGQVWNVKGMDAVYLDDNSVALGTELINKIMNGDVFDVNEYVESKKNSTGTTSGTTGTTNSTGTTSSTGTSSSTKSSGY